MPLPKLVLLLAAGPLALAAPASAQTHSMQGMSMPGMNMPGMAMPAKKKPAAKKKAARKPRPSPKAAAAANRRAAHAPAARRAAAAPQATPAHRAARPSGAMSHGMAGMPGTSGPSATSADPAHDMSSMPGMQMPAGHDMRPDRPGTGQPMAGMPGMTGAGSQRQAPSHDPMSGMPGMAGAGGTPQAPGQSPDMQNMPGMQMPNAGHQDMGQTAGMAAMDSADQSGTNLPAGNAPAPPAPTDHAADRVYPPREMAEGRHHLHRMHGGQDFYQVMFNLAEYRAQRGRDGYAWDGEAWYGGDIDRLWLKTEGEGRFRGGVERGEVQALYSHAVGPYFNLQGGLRYDLAPGPHRVFAAVGLEGLAPGFFEVESFLFLSDKGHLLGRAEAYYDQRVTQRLILQPRLEVNLAAQDVPENRIGAGISTIDAGLRLRYEIRREFAPYIGVVHERGLGTTARFRRADGEKAGSTSFVAGVRLWF